MYRYMLLLNLGTDIGFFILAGFVLQPNSALAHLINRDPVRRNKVDGNGIGPGNDHELQSLALKPIVYKKSNQNLKDIGGVHTIVGTIIANPVLFRISATCPRIGGTTAPPQTPPTMNPEPRL